PQRRDRLIAGRERPRDASSARRAIWHAPRLALALAVALAMTAGLTPASASAVPAPKLSWHPCADPAQKGLQCATARGVPLDYRHPGGRTIRLAVIRHRATDPAHRIGTLFFNYGGPGAPGTAGLARSAGLLPAAMRARFDVASWDPRGVGESTAVKCFASAQ